jgi:hypothetical protein
MHTGFEKIFDINQGHKSPPQDRTITWQVWVSPRITPNTISGVGASNVARFSLWPSQLEGLFPKIPMLGRALGGTSFPI